MVVKKKKTEKDKKEIEKLKKKLKTLTAKYLKDRKKRIKNPKDFKKIQDDIRTKVNQANSQQDLARLIALMGGKGSQPLNPATTGTIQTRLNKQNIINKQKKENKQDLADTYREIKVDFSNLQDKYNNGTLQVDDIKSLYSKTKGFANDIQQELPSFTSIIGMYQSAKKTYDYIRRFLNRNRPAQENPINLDEPPPQRNPEPAPQQPQQQPQNVDDSVMSGLAGEALRNVRGDSNERPEPPQMPRIVEGNLGLINMYNNLLGNYVAPASLALGALAGGGIVRRLQQRIAGRNNENRLIEQGEARNLANVAGNIAGAGVSRALGANSELNREGLDSSQDISERLRQNQEDSRRLTELRQQARQATENLKTQMRTETQRASEFRIREAEREARQRVGNLEQEQGGGLTREQNLAGSGVSVSDLDNMRSRLRQEANEEYGNADDLVNRFSDNLEQQLGARSRFEAGAGTDRMASMGGEREQDLD